mgnify:CR=1 FL=1
MKTIPFPKAAPNLFRLEFLSAMQYHPKLLHCEVCNRRSSSFLFIEKGHYLYRIGAQKMYFNTGDIIFLPQDGSYVYTVLEPGFVYQIEFKAFTPIGEPLTFSTQPECIGRSSTELLRYFNRITQPENYINPYESYYTLYRIFSILAPENMPVLQSSKIYMAIKYIHAHYNKKITTKELCGLCYTSPAQLRRRFRAEINTTPLNYQNDLRLKTAKRMLQSSENSITEIATFLGFESVYSFSLFFKKRQGVSPSKYKKSKRINSDDV